MTDKKGEKKEEIIKVKEDVISPKLIEELKNNFEAISKAVEQLFNLGKLDYSYTDMMFTLGHKTDALLKDPKNTKLKDYKLRKNIPLESVNLIDVLTLYVNMLKEGHSKGGITYAVALQLRRIEENIKALLTKY